MSEPSFQRTFLSCKCGHEWTDHLPINCRVELWTAAVKMLRCPACGGSSRKIMFGQKPKEAPVNTKKHLAVRLTEWRRGGGTGLSSNAIATFMVIGPYGETTANHPHDPGDLGRCLRLLRIIPEWQSRIGEMAACGVVWAALVARWDELERSMADECGIFWEKAKSAPKTYAMMREIIDGARLAA